MPLIFLVPTLGERESLIRISAGLEEVKGCLWEQGWCPNRKTLDVFEPGGSATAPFPKLKSWTPVPFPNLKIWTPANTFIVPANLCFSTYDILFRELREAKFPKRHQKIFSSQWQEERYWSPNF
jgi:hypothetical protein